MFWESYLPGILSHRLSAMHYPESRKVIVRWYWVVHPFGKDFIPPINYYYSTILLVHMISYYLDLNMKGWVESTKLENSIIRWKIIPHQDSNPWQSATLPSVLSRHLYVISLLHLPKFIIRKSSSVLFSDLSYSAILSLSHSLSLTHTHAHKHSLFPSFSVSLTIFLSIFLCISLSPRLSFPSSDYFHLIARIMLMCIVLTSVIAQTQKNLRCKRQWPFI